MYPHQPCSCHRSHPSLEVPSVALMAKDKPLHSGSHSTERQVASKLACRSCDFSPRLLPSKPFPPLPCTDIKLSRPWVGPASPLPTLDALLFCSLDQSLSVLSPISPRCLWVQSLISNIHFLNPCWNQTSNKPVGSLTKKLICSLWVTLLGCGTHPVAISCSCSPGCLGLVHRPDCFCRAAELSWPLGCQREADPGKFAHQVEACSENLYPLHLHP